MWTKYDNEIEVLFDELVPMSGKCDSLAGELVRALNRIVYRYFNDGDKIGVGYGKETCNPAARFLLENGNSEVNEVVSAIWGTYSEKMYEIGLNALAESVIDMVNKNPELRDAPTEDMWDYEDPNEDVDDEDW